jgi:PAS domain S-box-containing protein
MSNPEQPQVSSSMDERDQLHIHEVASEGPHVDLRPLESILAESRSLVALNGDVSRALIQRGTLRERLQQCTQALVDHLGVAFARIWTLNEGEAVLELQASSGMYTHLDGPHGRVPLGKLKIGLIAAERRPHLTNSVCDDPRISDHAWARREGMVSFAGYPLIVEEQLVGVMALFARYPLTESTLQAMKSVVNSIALGVERSRSEDLMRQSEELFRTAFANARVGMALTDLTGHFLQVNHAYSMITGYTMEELFQTDFLSITYPEDRARKMLLIEEMMNGTIPGFVIEKRYCKKDGTIVWVHNSVSLGHDTQGQPLHIITLTEDITQRKQAEEERNLLLQREQEARAEAERAWHHLHGLLQQAPAIICILRGPQHIYELANPLYQQIVSNRELLGKPIREALPELEGQGIYELLDRVYQTGEPFVGNEIGLELDRGGQSETIFLNFVYQAFYSADGIVDGILCHAIDVTEQVVARQRMDTFLGIASHELKTPLTSIKGNVQLARRSIRRALQEKSPQPAMLLQKFTEIQTMLERAEQQIDFQNRLVGDLIDITRIQAEKLDMRMASTDLLTVVRKAVEEQRRVAHLRTIHLTLPPDESIMLNIDADRIGQVIINYLTNALKYSDAAAPVSVELQRHETDVCIAVTDQGPGLSETQQQHLWERFYRVPGVEVKSGSGVGLGLGLHICQTIITHHGGQLGVKSQIGMGSTFWFSLPIARGE